MKVSISMIIGILLITSLSECSDTPVEIFISPEGADGDPGTIEQPFKSLERAREEIRKLKDEGVQSDMFVYLREGTYFMNQTFVLGLEDSAPDGHTITYAAYGEEEVVLHSGVRITGWERVEEEIPGLPPESRGKLWKAGIPDGMGRFLTLYDGEQRLPRARTKGFIPETPHPEKERRWSYDHFTLEFPEGTLRNWENLEDVELIIIPSYPWSMNILSLESVDEKTGVARTTLPATYPMRRMPGWIFDRPEFSETCWIENVPEGLDSPGEWMLNTTNQTLYLWPSGDEPGDDIFAPSLTELIRVEGTNDTWGDEDIPVEGIAFRGLTFTKADRGIWNENDAGIQHDWEMLDKNNAMLRFSGAEYCRVDACHFHHAGGNAIRLDRYAQHIHVENCLFNNLGQSAVMMIGYGPGTKDVNKHNRVYNNHIHHCGEIYWHSQMVTAWQSGHNYIGYNYFHHIPRKAVCISGVRASFLLPEKRDLRECGKSIRWSEVGDASEWSEFLPFCHSRNNVVEFNEVHHALEMLGDGAVINLSAGGDDNVIRNNYVHHILTQNASACIRMDGYQRKTLVENNVVFYSGVAGISPKGENTIQNNYVVHTCLSRPMGNIRGFARIGGQGISDFNHNIVYNPVTDTDLLFYHGIESYSEEDFRAKNVDHNIWFNPTRPVEENSGLVALKSKGADLHSLYADPMFEAWEKGDFTLKAESPAHALGIKQIDLSQVGLTGEYPEKFRHSIAHSPF